MSRVFFFFFSLNDEQLIRLSAGGFGSIAPVGKAECWELRLCPQGHGAVGRHFNKKVSGRDTVIWAKDRVPLREAIIN